MHLTLTAIIDGVPYVFETDQQPGETRADTVERCMNEQVWPFIDKNGLSELESVDWAWS